MMNKGGACVMATSGGSASPTSSSGAPSSSSIMAETDEKDMFMPSQLIQNGLANNQLMSMILQQQSNQADSNIADAGHNNSGAEKNIIELLMSGNADLMKFATQFAQQAKSVDQEPEEQRESSPSPPPAVSLNSTLASMVFPTTSTATECSAASTTSSVDSAPSTVIVNGHSNSQSNTDDDDVTQQPSAKKQRTGDETPLTPTSNNQLMQSLLAQMGLSNPLHQQNQKQMKDESMMFSGLFPQGLAGIPLMFQSPLHQQFAGMQDFEPLSALSTPNKGSGVKRQYSSNNKNFCDICNKEVCNKYFLRTHMLKMHGIVIDENKTVIANIDTSIKEREGELTFRCDTCRTMFKTRNQLRQHRQDVHGVLPLSTPRNNPNKSSVPTTPNGANNNSGPNSASMSEEKCALCDKRVSPSMMMLHMAQDHFGAAAANGDLNQMMAILGQRNQSTEEKMSSNLLECTDCSYKTRDPKNLDLHMERHIKMSEAKGRGDEDEDVALQLTTEAALQMVVQNQNQYDGDSTAAALNLTFKNDGTKKEIEEEKATGNHERNSHTSGSISPSGSIPEGFGKNIGEKAFPTQSFLIKCNDDSGEFLTEFLAQLPVRSVIDGPRQLVFNLHPAPPTTS
ncbi:C2H2-type domain-containing protein [Caenorhabditis elegans]|nr:C2H2-type domain-containing protein [Caenorhabditis elegans]CZR14453.1 C2H2-type domain-containing protein [Caenorhabditis elegans]|eukprot:NP_001309538.1 Dorsal Intercalation and Elongation defect [Caenorhabditis elegans]